MASSGGRGRALVLGAGLQGTSAALALRHAGWDVEVVDRAATPFSGASVHGEGKLHLGFVYANEPSRRTAALMLDGALSFSRLLDHWLPTPIDWTATRSEPFAYAVLEDSLCSVDDLAEHYAWVEERARERVGDGEPYAGQQPDWFVERVEVGELSSVQRPLAGAFRTSEVAVDPVRVRAGVVGAMDALDIPFRGGTDIDAVERTPHGFRVRTAGDESDLEADVVVNCLWDGRLAVDATVGLTPDRPWVFRLKQCVEGRLPPSVPSPGSITFVLGPYGDTVARADGRIYGSWYPECLVGWSDEIAPPASWRPLMDGELDPTEAAARTKEILEAFAEVVPSIAHLDVERLGAGVIFAWGERDIDDPTSELHERSDIGVLIEDGYATINTGKLTTAPLWADQLARDL